MCSISHAALICLLLVEAITPGGAPSAENGYRETFEQIVNSSGPFAKEHGRDAAIARYRALVDEHPGHEMNVLAEMKMAELWNWQMTERNEMPDERKSVEWALAAIDRHPADGPYMKLSTLAAASMAKELFPEKSKVLLGRLLNQYPDDDLLKLRVYLVLATICQNQGDLKTAEQYRAAVLISAIPAGPESLRGEFIMYHSNAANGLFQAAYWSERDPAPRLAKVLEVLRKYPQIPAIIPRRMDDVQNLQEEVRRRSVNAARRSISAAE